KYTALFLWFGIGLWVLLIPAARHWLRRWQPWAACAIGLALFSPVLLWNAEHEWAGLTRQGGRIEDWRPARAIGFLAELIGGQVGLATPLIWALCVAGLGVATWRTWRSRDRRWSLLVALSLPPAAVFVQHAIGDRVQGNWPAIIYPALTVAAGAMAVSRRWWVAAATLGSAITAVVYVQAATDVLPLPAGLDPITMRLAGWDGLAKQVNEARTAAGVRFVAGDGYTLGSELAWWLPAGATVIGTDERWRLLDLPRAPLAGQVGILVEQPNRHPDKAVWDAIEPVGTAGRPASGTPDLMLYRVTPRPGTTASTLPCRCGR
ncbi:MAG TPA: hypothetical protein VGM32_15160, partial [Rhodopila sp.]